ncbi:diguanylate cyclase [Singulisphaera sp. PoT]|uniref:diguanylate cyclase n=1 Tax=Singulisphaera sp. PoT TaxID=3411797 RepID=UPI003BF53C93
MLVEDSPTQALRTQLVLEDAGWNVTICGDGNKAVSMASETAPDLILLDMRLPGIDGSEVARRLKDVPGLSDIPIIFLTGVFREVEDIIGGLDQGADDYLVKPVADGELVARVRACLRVRRLQHELGRMAGLLLSINQVGSRISGILELEKLLDAACKLLLSELGYPSVSVFLREDDQDEFLLVAAAGRNVEGVLASAPRFVINDDSLMASSIRSRRILFTNGPSLGKVSSGWEGIHSGAIVPLHVGTETRGALLIASPEEMAFDERDELALETIADQFGAAIHNARLYRQMEELATLDSMTGLLNRRAILSRLDAEWSRCRRSGRSLALMSVDIDRFKLINDNYGHAIGDDSIVAVAAVIRRITRRDDFAGRLGGDEFLIVMPETDRQGGLEAAERLRVAVEQLEITSQSLDVPLSITLSLGVASIPEIPADDPAKLLQASDQALYRAKAFGRNRASI